MIDFIEMPKNECIYILQTGDRRILIPTGLTQLEIVYIEIVYNKVEKVRVRDTSYTELEYYINLNEADNILLASINNEEANINLKFYVEHYLGLEW